jgi:hypothetical protein
LLQTAAKTKGIRGGEEDQQRRVLTQQEGCVLTIEETQFFEEEMAPLRYDTAGSRRNLKKLSTAHGTKEWVCELTGVDAENAEDKIVEVTGLDESFFVDNDVESGETMMYVPQATIQGHSLTIPADNSDVTLETKSKSTKSSKSDNDRRRQRRLNGLSSTDTSTQAKTLNKQRRILVVRVGSSGDSRKTSSSASQLADDIFTDNVSLATQYKRCSYGKLDIVAATGNNIVGGVVTVDLSGRNINGAESSTVRTWMTDAAQAKIGVGSLSSAYSHVMFCEPPGTVKSGSSNWYVNERIQIYNCQKNCSFPNNIHFKFLQVCLCRNQLVVQCLQ